MGNWQFREKDRESEEILGVLQRGTEGKKTLHQHHHTNAISRRSHCVFHSGAGSLAAFISPLLHTAASSLSCLHCADAQKYFHTVMDKYYELRVARLHRRFHLQYTAMCV